MLAFDLRDAVRGLARDRLYSSIVVVTLALAIGATTAVFAIVNGVLLTPLPYREAGRLVIVNEVVRELADQYPMLPVNPRHFDLRTSGTLFDVLQVQPALGRLLTRADEERDRPRVAVVSHAMWRDRMDADPGAIGRSIVVDGVQHTVVGVLPAGLRLPSFTQLVGPGQLNGGAEALLRSEV